VFFCCDNCGESLKKNQVEKHGYRCRSSTYSCLDCQLRFDSSSYADHVKCITENQKYGGKGYVEKEAKGELKQNAWCEQVDRAIECVKDPALKNLLTSIQGFGNIPRKEPKFINFLVNSCRMRDKGLIQRAWKAIADEAEKLKKEDDAAKAAAVAKIAENTTSIPTKSSDNQDIEVDAPEPASASSFKWKATIKRKLKEAGGELKVKKLRTAVLEEYELACGDSTNAESLFDEKLLKAGVSVDGKKAILVA